MSGEYKYDPDHVLASLRESVQLALGIAYREDHAALRTNPATLVDVLTDIAETFDNLDEHVAKGGPLPRDWMQPDERMPR